MTTDFDPASVAEAPRGSADQALGQFEPDNDGTWDDGTVDPIAPPEALEDPQWVVWADAALESAWAGSEVAVAWLAVMRVAPAR